MRGRRKNETHSSNGNAMAEAPSGRPAAGAARDVVGMGAGKAKAGVTHVRGL